MHFIILLVIFLLSLTGCATRGHDWPTVAFSSDLRNFDHTSTIQEIVLAPLPTLSEIDREGIESPELYWQKLNEGFLDLKRRLEEGLNKLKKTETKLATSGGATNDLRLATELELSNLSLMIEELPIIRARAALLGQVTSKTPSLEALVSDAESLEITYRSLLLHSRLP